jgi:hypothetical protein
VVWAGDPVLLRDDPQPLARFGRGLVLAPDDEAAAAARRVLSAPTRLGREPLVLQ